MQPKIKQLTSLQNDLMGMDKAVGKLRIKDPHERKLIIDAIKEMNKSMISLYSSTMSPEELSSAYKNIFSQLAVMAEHFFNIDSPDLKRKLVEQVNKMSEKTFELENQNMKPEKVGLLNMVLGELKSQGITTMAPSVIQAVNLAVDAAVAKGGENNEDAKRVGDLAKNTAANVLTTLAKNPSKQGLVSAVIGGAMHVAGGVVDEGVKAASNRPFSSKP